jgi:hypothetical protein
MLNVSEINEISNQKICNNTRTNNGAQGKELGISIFWAPPTYIIY